MTTPTETTPPGRWLTQLPPGGIDAPRHLWGYGGLHGGLALAMLARTMRHPDDVGPVRSATARFDRPLTGAMTAHIEWPRKGRAVATVSAQQPEGASLAAAWLITGSPRPADHDHNDGFHRGVVIEPVAPSAPPPADCERFSVPTGQVPITAFLEVRPIGLNRPYRGGGSPELTAWVRLTEDEQPPDPYRLILLMDALAPSYAAVLTEPVPIPTVEFSVRMGDGLRRVASPWVLLHAKTTCASRDGWIHEHLEAWDIAGTHLATAQQTRVTRQLRAFSSRSR